MRGDEKRRTRAANLRKLQDKYTFEYIAEKTGTNPVYLSQIANEVIGKDRKKPRALSDSYAEKIENGLNLDEGWLDLKHNSNGSDRKQSLAINNLIECYQNAPTEIQEAVTSMLARYKPLTNDPDTLDSTPKLSRSRVKSK